MGFILFLELTSLWGSLCSLGQNNLDTAAEDTIKAAWNNRTGQLAL